jgi:hypothetical protein
MSESVRNMLLVPLTASSETERFSGSRAQPLNAIATPAAHSATIHLRSVLIIVIASHESGNVTKYQAADSNLMFQNSRLAPDGRLTR